MAVLNEKLIFLRIARPSVAEYTVPRRLYIAETSNEVSCFRTLQFANQGIINNPFIVGVGRSFPISGLLISFFVFFFILNFSKGYVLFWFSVRRRGWLWQTQQFPNAAYSSKTCCYRLYQQWENGTLDPRGGQAWSSTIQRMDSMDTSCHGKST